MQLSEAFKKSQHEWLKANPVAFSALYDLNLLPEQAQSPEQEHFIQGVIFGLKVAEQLNKINSIKTP